MLSLLQNRLVTSILSIPSLKDWSLTACILAIYAITGMLIGFYTHFLYWNSLPANWGSIIVKAFFAPALMEEVIFRVLPLPYPNSDVETKNIFFWSMISLFLFVLYHPLNALLFYKVGFPTFLNPVFLALATLLGIACTTSYILSKSLWPPVTIHWIVVSVWLCQFGGIQRLT